MDNASIHHANVVRQVVENREFQIFYLPAYLLFLKRIELFWSKLKAGVRGELLTNDATLTPLIIESANR